MVEIGYFTITNGNTWMLGAIKDLRMSYKILKWLPPTVGSRKNSSTSMNSRLKQAQSYIIISSKSIAYSCLIPYCNLILVFDQKENDT